MSDGRVKGGREGGREGERRVQRMCPPLTARGEGAFFTLGVRWGAVVWHGHGLSTVLSLGIWEFTTLSRGRREEEREAEKEKKKKRKKEGQG